MPFTLQNSFLVATFGQSLNYEYNFVTGKWKSPKNLAGWLYDNSWLKDSVNVMAYYYGNGQKAIVIWNHFEFIWILHNVPEWPCFQSNQDETTTIYDDCNVDILKRQSPFTFFQMRSSIIYLKIVIDTINITGASVYYDRNGLYDHLHCLCSSSNYYVFDDDCIETYDDDCSSEKHVSSFKLSEEEFDALDFDTSLHHPCEDMQSWTFVDESFDPVITRNSGTAARGNMRLKANAFFSSMSKWMNF